VGEVEGVEPPPDEPPPAEPPPSPPEEPPPPDRPRTTTTRLHAEHPRRVHARTRNETRAPGFNPSAKRRLFAFSRLVFFFVAMR
jgi:hypothetical protein